MVCVSVCVGLSVCLSVGVTAVLQLLPMMQTRPFSAQVQPVILFSDVSFISPISPY